MDPFFEDWARTNGYSRIGNSIGFMLTATLNNRE